MMTNSRSNKVEIKKLAIIGPECSGKTELSKYLAHHYNCPWVREYARSYLARLNRPYKKSDLTEIARGQVNSEDECVGEAPKLLICDTNLLVIKIWSNYKYGDCNPQILKMISSRHYDLLFLTHVDIPWEYDPQRENKDSRELLLNIYREEVIASHIPFVEIMGSRNVRQKKAVEVINRLID